MQVLHQNILSTLLVYECENWSLYATSPLTHYPHLSFTSASYELPQGWQILLLLRYVSDTQFCNIGVIIKQLSTYPVWRECCNIERYISSTSVKNNDVNSTLDTRHSNISELECVVPPLVHSRTGLGGMRVVDACRGASRFAARSSTSCFLFRSNRVGSLNRSFSFSSSILSQLSQEPASMYACSFSILFRSSRAFCFCLQLLR